jgi:hypothetical protein
MLSKKLLFFQELSELLKPSLLLKIIVMSVCRRNAAPWTRLAIPAFSIIKERFNLPACKEPFIHFLLRKERQVLIDQDVHIGGQLVRFFV